MEVQTLNRESIELEEIKKRQEKLQNEQMQRLPSSIFMNGTFATNYERQMRAFKRAASKNERTLATTLTATSVERERKETSIKKIEESPV